MPQRTSPPRQHRMPTDAPDPQPQPIAQPREQRVMTEQQRAEWVRWLTDVLVKSSYAVSRPGGGLMFYWKALERKIVETTGFSVPWYTLINYVKKGSQPSAEIATALARTFGLHPLSVAHKAGIFSLHDLAVMLGSGHLRTPQALYEELELIRTLPEESISRQNIEHRILREINAVTQLQQSLALNDEEWGGLQAELVKLEITDGASGGGSFTVPTHPVHLPLPSGVTPPSQTRVVRAGPTRRHTPLVGEVPEE